jgi:hypothetical protein
MTPQQAARDRAVETFVALAESLAPGYGARSSTVREWIEKAVDDLIAACTPGQSEAAEGCINCGSNNGPDSLLYVFGATAGCVGPLCAVCLDKLKENFTASTLGQCSRTEASDGEWRCNCGELNASGRRTCRVCQGLRTVPFPPRDAAPIALTRTGGSER